MRSKYQRWSSVKWLAAAAASGLATVAAASNELCSQNTVFPFTAQNGGSSAPECNADGRFVVFRSFSSVMHPADNNGSLGSIFRYDRATDTCVMVDLSFIGIGPAGAASNHPAISGDGAVVAFLTGGATQMAQGVLTNGLDQIYVRNVALSTTECVSVPDGASGSTPSGAVSAGNGHSGRPTVSQDGRFVAFASRATNLGSVVPAGVQQIYLRDRVAKTTRVVSVDSFLVVGTADSDAPSVSADGRYVAFESLSKLHPADSNGNSDVYVRDTLLNVTYLASRDVNGTAGALASRAPSIARNATKVAFTSEWPLIGSFDNNNREDVYVADFAEPNPTLALKVASVEYSNTSTANDSSYDCSISGDGQRVTFRSEASNLVPSTFVGKSHIYVCDLSNLPTQPSGMRLHTLDCGGTPVGPVASIGNNTGNSEPAISWDGRVVSFTSFSDDFVCSPAFAGTPDTFDVFVRPVDCCPAPAATSIYGSNKGGSIGPPVISPVGTPSPGSFVGYQVTNALPGAIGYAFLGFQPATIPICGGQATLHLVPFGIRVLPPFPPSGTIVLAGIAPNDPALCGLTIYHQVMFQDPTASCFDHLSHTKGLMQTFGN